ncbi:MAG TPA: hypothetical protein VLS89_07120 [Candidatus Nanopelagicales bacterium]|nr:hypothetical protein [Candidatus Nanopelagicales bacterium]
MAASTTKSSTKASAKPRQAEPKAKAQDHDDEGGDDALIEVRGLDPAQQRFVRRSARFLMGISAPAYARRARLEGYTTAEHREGWRLCRLAAGENRPLDHFLAEVQVATVSDDAQRMAVLQSVDLFENTWFPRTRAIIRRVVPRDHRDAFAAGFFKDLTQQPLGPGVISSVSTFLKRIDGLAQSKDPHAKKVRQTLLRRGLTEQRLDEVRGLLAQLQGSAPAPDAPLVNPAEIAAAQEEQLEAYEDLRDWFNDWATTLRSRFNMQEQVRLGLSVLRRSGKVEDVTDEEPEEGEGEGGEG